MHDAPVGIDRNTNYFSRNMFACHLFRNWR